MARYRKKPVEVEAFRVGYDEPPEWAIAIGEMFDGRVSQLATRDGVAVINRGDYVIRGEHGQMCPCKPSIFEETYEEAE